MEIHIYLGTEIKIKRGFLKGALRLMYCGMPSKNTFALTPLTTRGYQGFSPTIYYSTESEIIQIMGIEFDVIEVNSEFIVLRD